MGLPGFAVAVNVSHLSILAAVRCQYLYKVSDRRVAMQAALSQVPGSV